MEDFEEQLVSGYVRRRNLALIAEMLEQTIDEVGGILREIIQQVRKPKPYIQRMTAWDLIPTMAAEGVNYFDSDSSIRFCIDADCPAPIHFRGKRESILVDAGVKFLSKMARVTMS
jgi:hypothetical protein